MLWLCLVVIVFAALVGPNVVQRILSNSSLTLGLKHHSQDCGNRINNGIIIIDGKYIYEDRRVWQQIADKAKAYVRDVRSGMKILPHKWKIFKDRDFYVRLDKSAGNYHYSWRDKNTALYLMVHGLNSHPAQWNQYADYIHQNHPDAELVVPYVFKKGNCAVAEAAEPILEMVRDYLATYPSNPVCVLGTSNGARIAGYVEYALRSVKGSRIHVTSLAGAHVGTRLLNAIPINIFAKLGFFDLTVAKELRFQSEVTINQIMAQRQPLPVTVSRTFLQGVSSEDSHIIPYTASLPILEQRETNFIIHAEGHSSVLSASHNYVMHSIEEWMTSITQK